MYVDVSPRTKYKLYMLFGRSQKGNCNAQVVYAIVNRRGGRSLDFRFYNANLHNLENLGATRRFQHYAMKFCQDSNRNNHPVVVRWDKTLSTREIQCCFLKPLVLIICCLYHPATAPATIISTTTTCCWWRTSLAYQFAWSQHMCIIWVYVFLYISANG